MLCSHLHTRYQRSSTHLRLGSHAPLGVSCPRGAAELSTVPTYSAVSLASASRPSSPMCTRRPPPALRVRGAGWSLTGRATDSIHDVFSFPHGNFRSCLSLAHIHRESRIGHRVSAGSLRLARGLLWPVRKTTPSGTRSPALSGSARHALARGCQAPSPDNIPDSTRRKYLRHVADDEDVALITHVPAFHTRGYPAHCPTERG